MTRVMFTLSMPGRSSWDGRWSGQGRNYILVHRLGAKALAELMDGKPERSWFHRWDDGWMACITARVLEPGSRVPKSDGFCGYDWMVRNILDHGDTREARVTA